MRVARREQAIALLGSLGPLAREAVPALVEVLEEDTDLSLWAADALGRIHAMPDEVVPALMRYARTHEGSATAAMSTRALGSFPTHRDEIAPFLAEIVLDDEPGIAEVALQSLAKLRAEGTAVTEALQVALRSADPTDALSLLAAMEDPPPAFLPAVRESLNEGAWTYVRVEAVRCLSSMAMKPSMCKEAVALLVSAAKDGSSDVRLEAVKALGDGYGCLQEEAVAVLVAALSDKDYPVALAAVISLGRLGPAAGEAGQVLRRLKDHWRQVPRWASDASFYPMDAAIDRALDQITRSNS